MTEELLSLSTIVARRAITIKSKLHPEGKLYELLDESELSVYQATMVQKCSEEVATSVLLERELTASEARSQRKALTEMVAIVAPSIEPSVLEALQPVPLLSIYGVFGRGVVSEEGDEGNAVAARTSAESSRGSKGSTAAARKRGSTSPGTSSTRS